MLPFERDDFKRSLFTRKHYNAIAETLQLCKSTEHELHSANRREFAIIVVGLATMFQEDNPRFNREQFYKTCGGID